MSKSGDNQPPDFELPLTKEEAEFLLKNTSSNIMEGLGLLSTGLPRSSAMRLVDMLRMFKAIRDRLRAMGVRED